MPKVGSRRASKLNPYKEYIRKRFQEDSIKATQILDEIQKLGYCGGRTIMMDWVKKTIGKFDTATPADETFTGDEKGVF